MTLCSNDDASVAADYVERTAANKATHPNGPYMQTIPLNPWNNSRLIAAAAATGNGWIYDETTGKIYIDVSDLDDAEAKTTLATADATEPAAG